MCHHSRCDPAVRFCILVSADEGSGIKSAHAADSLGTMQSMPCGDLHRLVWRLIGSNVVHTASASCLGTLENVPDEIAPDTADGLSKLSFRSGDSRRNEFKPTCGGYLVQGSPAPDNMQCCCRWLRGQHRSDCDCPLLLAQTAARACSYTILNAQT